MGPPGGGLTVLQEPTLTVLLVAPSYIGGEPESHFLVTFEWHLILRPEDLGPDADAVHIFTTLSSFSQF